MARAKYRRGARLLIIAMLGCALRAGAQAQVGDDLSLSLSGTVSGGYSAGNTNEGSSSHGMTFGGNGVLDGSFYSPSFLSFSVSPFTNQSRNNSGYQSTSASSGVTANAAIFGGSHFPGYVNYSRVYNGESNYSIPGVASYKTNGNTQEFGVGWSETVPDLPSLAVGYQQGSSDYSVYGATSGNHSDFHSVFGHTTYSVAGFRLGGGVQLSNIGSLLPQLTQAEPPLNTHSSSTTYNFNMNRNFGESGTTWVTVSRFDYGYRIPGASNSLASDVVTAGAAWKPTPKLSLQASGDYDDNLVGTLYQSLAEAGGPVTKATPGESSHSTGEFGMAQYKVLTGLYVAGTVTHRNQLFLGTTYGSTSYGGSLNFGHRALGGQFNAGINISRSSLSNGQESTTGLLSNLSYFRRFGAWDVNGSFNYSRNVQTFLVAYTSSGYTYSGSVSRRIGRVNWNGSASGSKSLLSRSLGSNTYSQSYSTGISSRWVGVSAGYSRATGTGILTSQGITPVPTGVPLPESPIGFIFYGGTTYSVGAGSMPIKGLTLNGNFATTRSNTTSAALSSNNRMSQGNAFMQYKFRKIYLTAGYSRLLQGFSSTGIPPSIVASYYVGVSRWFNFF